MTNLKDVNFGINQFCGPAVLSALTGESTDRCAAVISAVSGAKVIKAVQREHLKEALKRLRFDVNETNFSGSTLFGVLYRMHSHDGLYVVFVPHHVIAIEVKGTEIYICDNHSKTPLDIKQSARLTQRVEQVLKVSRKEAPKFIKSELEVLRFSDLKKIELNRKNEYECKEDNTKEFMGYLYIRDEDELRELIAKLIEVLR